MFIALTAASTVVCCIWQGHRQALSLEDKATKVPLAFVLESRPLRMNVAKWQNCGNLKTKIDVLPCGNFLFIAPENGHIGEGCRIFAINFRIRRTFALT